LTAAFAAQARAGEAPWLAALRANAFSRFQALGLPKRTDEEWKYTRLRGFDAAPWQLGPGESTFSSTRPLTGMKVSDLSEVLAQRPELLQQTLEAHAGSARAFEAAGAAFVGTGLVIEVQANTKVDATALIRHRAAQGAFFPRLVIILAPGAEASVIEAFDAPAGERAFTGSITDIILGPNSRLTYTKVQNDGETAYHVSSSRAVLARDARLVATSVAFGGQVTRNDFDVVLSGEGADATLDGFYLVTGKRHVDNHTSIDHRVPNTRSSQLYKGILAGQSRAVFNGKVFVRQDAQKTNAFQLNQNLLLSSDAEIDTKPQLEIDADDVKCSHGAAVGQLSADEIFYLQSRGIPRAEAERLLSLGFADEVLLKIEDQALREDLRRQVKESLHV
jgi:Fe-S cluster assembly protein SufD